MNAETALPLAPFARNGERRKKILSAVWLCLLATGCIFALSFATYGVFKVFPFGNNTLAQYDLLAQIVPFAEHFFDVMKGEASFFYSIRIGGGMDVFGTVAYCLCSPFTILFYLCGEGNVYYTASLLLPVKLSCIAVSAIVFMKLRFAKMENCAVLPCALLYAYSGYTFVANTYINWLDFLIYLPLALCGFSYMLKTGKVRYFALCIACSVYACFSIACFSMLISYPVLVAYGLIVLKKEERKGYLFRLSLAYLCGIAAALPVMLPALLAYLRSGRNTGIFASLFRQINADSYYSKFSYIFSDSFFFVLIAYYFVKTRFSTKESRFLGLSALLIMMPVLVDECCLLMNMGSYYSYSLRFGFLNAVYELYVSCLVLEGVRFGWRKKHTASENANTALERGKKPTMPATNAKIPAHTSPTSEKKGRIDRPKAVRIALSAALIALALLAVVVLYEVWCVNRQLDGLNFSFFPAFSDLLASAKESSKGFASSYAHSLGGLEGIAVVFGTVALVSVFAIFLYERRLVDARILFSALAVVLCAQVVYFGAVLTAGNIFTPSFYQEYNTLCERTITDRQYARIKDNSATFTNVGGLITDTNSCGVFSSVADRDNFAVNEVFGYGGNKVNTMQSKGGTLFGDALMGYRYYCQKTNGSSYLHYEYLTLLDETKRLAMYENSLVFPSAYTVGGELNIRTKYNDYFENMENLYTFLGGEEGVFEEHAIRPSDVQEMTVNDETGASHRVLWIKCYLYESGALSFYSELPTDKGLQWYTGNDCLTKNLRPISDVKTFAYCDAGSSYHLCIVCDDYPLTAEEVIERCAVKIISVQKMRRLKASLDSRAQSVRIENTLLSTRYRVEGVSAQAGESLFLNYVHIRGMRALVNGKEVALTENGLNLITVPLSEGTNDVEIIYTSPYYLYIGVGVLLGAGLLVGLYWLCRKKKVVDRAEGAVAVASLALAGAVVLFFMAFPTAIFVLKLFGAFGV